MPKIRNNANINVTKLINSLKHCVRSLQIYEYFKVAVISNIFIIMILHALKSQSDFCTLNV